MLNPWTFCDADDEVVADFLAASVQGLIEDGGWLHPETRLVARQGQIHVECDADDGEPLFRIPRAAFLRIGQLSWAQDAEALAMTGMTDAAAHGDLALLYSQIGLHNSCGKIPWLARTHPSLASDLTDEIIDAVRAIQPTFRVQHPSPADLFWRNRAFHLPAFSDESELIALPVLDLLNHHPSGAVGSWTGEEFVVDVRRPHGDAQCFLNYGLQRDALELAIVYGFADVASPHAHSAPLSVDVDGVGTIHIAAHGRSDSGEFLPIAVERVGDAWHISHLNLGDPRVVDELTAHSGQSEAWCRDVLHAVAAANLALLTAIDSAIDGRPRPESPTSGPTSGALGSVLAQDDVPAAAVLRSAVERQRTVITANLRPSVQSPS